MARRCRWPGSGARAGRLWLSGNRGISMITTEMRASAGQSTTLTSMGFAAEDGFLPGKLFHSNELQRSHAQPEPCNLPRSVLTQWVN